MAPGHPAALMEVIVSTPEPDWSDEGALADHLVQRARTSAGSGEFDGVSARAYAAAEVARSTNVM